MNCAAVTETLMFPSIAMSMFSIYTCTWMQIDLILSTKQEQVNTGQHSYQRSILGHEELLTLQQKNPAKYVSSCISHRSFHT